jgi:hypothetical protein
MAGLRADWTEQRPLTDGQQAFTDIRAGNALRPLRSY